MTIVVIVFEEIDAKDMPPDQATTLTIVDKNTGVVKNVCTVPQILSQPVSGENSTFAFSKRSIVITAALRLLSPVGGNSHKGTRQDTECKVPYWYVHKTHSWAAWVA